MYELFNEWFPSVYHIPGWWGVSDDYERLIDLTAPARGFDLTAPARGFDLTAKER